jgi:hypothetical protein
VKITYLTLPIIFALLFLAPTSPAGQLLLSDGTPSGTIVIQDNDSLDEDSGVGSITYFGLVGSHWSVSVNGFINSDFSNPDLELTPDAFAVGAAPPLIVELSETNFVGSEPFEGDIGGLTDSSVTYQAWIDTGDNLFGTNVLLGTLGTLCNSTGGKLG